MTWDVRYVQVLRPVHTERKRKRSKNTRKRSKNKRQTSKTIFAFAFAWCGHAFKGIPTPSVKHQRQWQRQGEHQIGSIGMHCDAWKSVPYPFSSITMHSSGPNPTLTLTLPLTLDARCGYTLSPADGFTSFSSLSQLHSVIQQTERKKYLHMFLQSFHRLSINQDKDYTVFFSFPNFKYSVTKIVFFTTLVNIIAQKLRKQEKLLQWSPCLDFCNLIKLRTILMAQVQHLNDFVDSTIKMFNPCHRNPKTIDKKHGNVRNLFRGWVVIIAHLCHRMFIHLRGRCDNHPATETNYIHCINGIWSLYIRKLCGQKCPFFF